jgi:hypothetical protein
MKTTAFEDVNCDDKAWTGTSSRAPSSFSGALVGNLLGFDEASRPLVQFPGLPFTDSCWARSTILLEPSDIGSEVVLVFDQNDSTRPVVIGRVQSHPRAIPGAQRSVQVDVDGETVTISAKEKLVLRCGKASITLTKAGKVILSGAYVSSSATGVNRIRGGSVHLN